MLALIISLVFSLNGCIERFDDYREGDAYVCKISEDVEFWCSPSRECGEFIIGEITIPVLIFARSSVSPNLLLYFFSPYGNQLASLVLWLRETSYYQATIVEVGELQVEDELDRARFEELLHNIPFEDACVEKIRKYVPQNTPSVFQAIDSFITQAKETKSIIISENESFWFDTSTGYGEMTLQNGTIKEIKVELQNRYNYSYHYFERVICVTSGEKALYRVLHCDEKGVYFWNEEGDEKSKVVLQLATEDPRQIYFDFLSCSNGLGNNYIFVCEEGNFNFAGEAGLGVWQNGTGAKDIQCTIGDRAFALYIYHIDDTETSLLLIAQYIEMVDETSARFRIYDDFLTNEIFPDRTQTEFVITKQVVSNT